MVRYLSGLRSSEMGDIARNSRGKAERFVRVIGAISVAGGEVSAWVVVMMVALTFYEAFMRYVFNRAPMLADEISAYMFVLVCFVGLAYTWKEKGHVRMSFLITKLPAKVAYRLRSITLVLAFVYAVLLTKFSYDFIITSYKVGMRSGSWLQVPMEWPRGVLFVGFLLLSLHLIAEFIKHIQSPER